MAKLSNIVKEIPINQIVTDNKKFNLSLKLKAIGLWTIKDLGPSLQIAVLANPILLISLNDNYCLLDGYKRLEIAQKLGMENVPAITIDEITNKQIILYLLFNNMNNLTSAASKAVFLAHALDSEVDIDFILKNIMPKLDLGSNKQLLEKYIKISNLPQNILSFCHKKGVSFKKTLHFTTYNLELLNWLFHVEEKLTLTASICRELLENINDILRRDEIEFEQFLKLTEIKDIFNKDLEPSRRTNLLREKVKALRYPEWTNLNNKMKKIKKEYFIDSPLDVAWDESLENRRLLLKGEITSCEDLETFKNALKSKKLDKGIKKLLSYL